MCFNSVRRLCAGARLLVVFAIAAAAGSTVFASNLDTIGASLLAQVTTNLNGTGIRVAQAEAEVATNPPAFEVRPGAVSQPVSLFTYQSSLGASSAFPNTVGAESTHADAVAADFYGLGTGVATNVAHVDNYDADYFYNSVVNSALPANINDPVVNQSFIFDNGTVSGQQTTDSAYDNYSAQFNTLFVSGVGNGGPVNAPATCYNGIGVAAYGGSSSIGPTPDNGRCKPDLTAPAGATSFSTPLVAGAAAVLLQAALRGDGGSDTNSAADMRTLKALLLNGAVKPADWTNGPATPLDARYGAGIVNVFNSYEQLAGGQHGYTATSTVPNGGAHPPTGANGSVGAPRGWDFNTISSQIISEGLNEYYFDVTNGSGPFAATVSLVWERHQNQTGINNLDLFLYDAVSGNLMAASTSAVDNVQQLFIPRLAPGRYDLQVLDLGGLGGLSRSETYALAFDFSTAPPLRLSPAGANLALHWPIYPAGLVLQSTTNLSAPNWTAVNAAVTVTNRQNEVPVSPSAAGEFFRLAPP